MKIKTPKRMIIQISEEFHAEIKKRAKDRGVTLTRYVHKALWDQVKRDISYDCEKDC